MYDAWDEPRGHPRQREIDYRLAVALSEAIEDESRWEAIMPNDSGEMGCSCAAGGVGVRWIVTTLEHDGSMFAHRTCDVCRGTEEAIVDDGSAMDFDPNPYGV